MLLYGVVTTFPHRTATKQRRSICFILKHFLNNYLAAHVSPINLLQIRKFNIILFSRMWRINIWKDILICIIYIYINTIDGTYFLRSVTEIPRTVLYTKTVSQQLSYCQWKSNKRPFSRTWIISFCNEVLFHNRIDPV